MSVLTNTFGMILKFIYETLGNIGPESQYISHYALSLIIMALLQKIIFMPMTLKASKNAQKGQELNAGVNKIREKYKNDPETQNRKIMEYYKENDYNPAAGCLPMLIPLIFIFAMMGVVKEPANYIFDNADKIHDIAKNFFWISDLTQPDPLVYGLPLIYSISMFLYTSLTQSSTAAMDASQAQMNNTMKYMMPVMMFFFSRQWTSGLILFWAASNILEVIIRLFGKISLSNKEELS